ncbi:Hypothetical predicted protein [Podarcis lilfordi]|uniref:C-type lectin domain-containing protein n=1 Tax=Podarcis lilfordi TaxID=74358 RepID=A0AA35L004_9SAUR|nr:Hypothetical predicted protein [Podarcis lilfordi]
MGHQVPMGRITFFHLSIWGFLIACSFPQGTEASGCPQNWFRFQGHCYLLRKVKRNWNDAEADCQRFGTDSHLASILNWEEHRYIASAIRQGKDPGFHIWIGLFRVKRGGRITVWKWTDSAVVGYMPWGPGQPSYSHRQEFCIELYGAEYMFWDDNSCEAENYYICKIPVSWSSDNRSAK